MAEYALEREMDEQCVFHCQQAIEKLLKALLIEREVVERPRRTHDLVSLADDLVLDLADDDWVLLRRLGEQYATSRYGEDVDYEQEHTLDYLTRTRALFEWLRQQPS